MLELLAAASGSFDVETATRAYLDTLQGATRHQSDAYFEGGYWLPLWGALAGALFDWLVLRLRIAHAIRAWGERRLKRLWLVTWFVGLGYSVLAEVVLFPWTLYTGYFREKQYGLLDQPFGAWFGEHLIGLGLSFVVAPLLVVAIYALIRRAPRSWWLWGTGVIGLFMMIGMVLGPVFVAPLFNDYREMPSGPLRDRIEAVAAKYDIPADHIYVFDQSKQHKRISANVSGLGPTIRISLNDNLLERTSEPEILAVMGHEMGHYKLGHIWWMIGVMLALFALGLFVISRLAPALIRRYGERWGVRDIGDAASLPLLSVGMSLWMLLMTPATNSLVRWSESAADAFGLDAAQEPDGFAKVAMRLSEYRKIEPGPLEEAVFFDHPSGATRVRMAMQWKADHVVNPQMIVPDKTFLEGQ